MAWRPHKTPAAGVPAAGPPTVPAVPAPNRKAPSTALPATPRKTPPPEIPAVVRKTPSDELPAIAGRTPAAGSPVLGHDTPPADVRAIVREMLGDATPAGGSGGLGWMDEAEPEKPGAVSGWARPGAKPKPEHDEVSEARHIQHQLLPQPPRIPNLTCAARFEPHHEVSGDFYDFIILGSGRIGVVQGDVSGHGVAAGMVMAMAKQTIRMLATTGASPLKVLTEANRWLHGAMAGKFVSASYMTIDTGSGEMHLARAGHTPTVLVNAATGNHEVLAPKGLALGIRGTAEFTAATEELHRGLRPADLLLVATDGILEAKDRLGEEFGLERLSAVMAQHAPAGAEAVVNRVLDAARNFQGSAKLDDDAMVVAVGFG